MAQIAGNAVGNEFTQTYTDALNGRILRTMIVCVALAVTTGLAFAPWRFTLGLAVGGALSILNYYWLHSSVTALINLNTSGKRARARSSRYFLRYLAGPGSFGCLSTESDFAAGNLRRTQLIRSGFDVRSFTRVLFLNH